MVETVIWMLGAVVVVMFSGSLTMAYYRAWVRINSMPRLPIGEPIRIPAWANFRREAMRVGTQALFLLVSFISFYQLALGPVEGIRFFSISLLLAGQLLMALNSWSDWRDDGRLVQSVDEWDQHYVAIPKDRLGHQSQRDRIEATGLDTNSRLRRGDIGRDQTAVVQRDQADSIQATGEDSNRILRDQDQERQS